MRSFGADWRGLETPRHLCLFSAKSLGKVVRENGLPDAKVFCARGAHDLDFMTRASCAIADARGRVPPAFDTGALKRVANRSFWSGSPRDEFLVLVAHKAR